MFCISQCVARVWENRNAYGVLLGKLTARDHLEDGRKILGCVLKKLIGMCGGWRAVVNTVMNLWAQ